MKLYINDGKIIAVETTIRYDDNISITMKCLTDCTVSSESTDSKEILASILPRYTELASTFFASQEAVVVTVRDSEEITIP